MNQTLVTILVIAAAIGIAMAITVWRIRRLQYPPHLQWPKRDKSRRRRRSKPQDDQDPRK